MYEEEVKGAPNLLEYKSFLFPKSSHLHNIKKYKSSEWISRQRHHPLKEDGEEPFKREL